MGTIAGVSLLILGCMCKCYCNARRKLKDLSKTMHKSDKKKSGSGDDVNACVESEVVRKSNVQQRNTPEDRVSLGSDRVKFVKGSMY